MDCLIIKNATVVDPANSVEEKRDLFVKNGVFVEKASGKQKVIDAKNKFVFPGFVDVHCHLREPGQTAKETIESGTAAAAAGGFTSILAMPNTKPCVDSASTFRLVSEIVKASAAVKVYLSACITENREGKKLAPIGTLKNAGAIALTDDGSCVQNNELMLKALEYAKMFNLVVMDHCQDADMTAKGQMNDGLVSLKLGLGGWPNAAEDIIVSRNIILSKYTGAHVHMQHLSSAYSVDLVRNAKKAGINVSAEATPHHIALTDESLIDYDTNYKVNPPLRTKDDVKAVIKGLCDGTIDVIATDHAPHSPADKNVEFDYAPCGMIGFETAFSVCYKALVLSGKMKLSKLIKLMTISPAKLLGINAGSLQCGMPADFCIADLSRKYVYNKSLSRSKNSPWFGKELIGKIEATFVNGKPAYRE